MRVAVVGVGAAGLATALQLTDDGPVDLDLTLFDPQFKDPEQSAQGRAYQMDHGGPLLNAPSSMMSVRADDEEDFARWMRRRTQEDRGWRALFVALCDEAMADVWNLLDEASRRVFLRWSHPYFQSWCNPMPPSTAAGLAKAMDYVNALDSIVRTVPQAVADALRAAAAARAADVPFSRPRSGATE